MPPKVCYRRQPRKHLLFASISHFDPQQTGDRQLPTARRLIRLLQAQPVQPDSLGKLTNGQPIHHARPMHVDRACASELRACATELAQLFGVGAIGDHKALGPLARTSITRLIEIEQRGQRYF